MRRRYPAIVATTTLPRIVRYLGKRDDGDGAVCPHCGSGGRYIHSVLLENGTRIGAMAGCIQLFPMAPIAREEMRLRGKEADYAKRDWSLPSWDLRMLAAIERFYTGELTEWQALAIVQDEKRAAQVWREQRRQRRSI